MSTDTNRRTQALASIVGMDFNEKNLHKRVKETLISLSKDKIRIIMKELIESDVINQQQHKTTEEIIAEQELILEKQQIFMNAFGIKSMSEDELIEIINEVVESKKNISKGIG